jgi:glutathione S-transferase
MHSGFDALRTEMPMDMNGSKPVPEVSQGVARDVARIAGIWRMCRTTYGAGGPYLFGEFCAADAMYAPVTSRLRTYGVDLDAHGDDGTGKAYCETILSLPEIEQWTQAGREEMSERGTAY